MAAPDWEAVIVATVTGFMGIVSAAGGVLLIIRSVRDRERKAAKADYEQSEAQLHAEREVRVRLEELAYTQRVLLAQNGIALPLAEVPMVAHIEPAPDPSGPSGLSALGDRLHRRRSAAGGGGGGDESGGVDG